MKKIAALFAVISTMLVFLQGCYAAKDPDNLFETSIAAPSSFSETTIDDSHAEECSEESLSLSVFEHIDETDTEEGYYQYGNMQKNVPSGNFIMHDGRIVFEMLKNGRFILYEIDPDSLEVLPFEKDATLNNYPDEGNYDYFGGELEQYKGELYGLISGKKVGKWSQNHWKSVVDGSVNYFWHAKDVLFVVSSDGSLIRVGDGQTVILVDEYTAYWNVVFHNMLYGQIGDRLSVTDIMQEKPEVNILLDGIEGAIIDGDHIYYCDRKYYLYRCEMDGANPQQLTDYGVLPASLNFDDKYLYFRKYDGELLQGGESSSIYRLEKRYPDNIALISELFSEEDRWILNIYTVPGEPYIIINVYEKGNSEIKYFAVQIDGNGYEELLIP